MGGGNAVRVGRLGSKGFDSFFLGSGGWFAATSNER